MDVLHAPWRIDYILAPKQAQDESLFTRIARSSDDTAHHVIARRKTCYALLNTYPYNGGHLMVVPYRQISDLADLTDEESAELMKLMQECVAAIKRCMKPDGFNVGINIGKCAGAGIANHLHIHVVPRWSGDTNFMPVLGQTSVLPQALTEVATQLREALAADRQ
jgi:ATP adenylyltransferase